jgi:hypothetical protein
MILSIERVAMFKTLETVGQLREALRNLSDAMPVEVWSGYREAAVYGSCGVVKASDGDAGCDVFQIYAE